MTDNSPIGQAATPKPLVVGSNPSAASFLSTQPPHQSYNADILDFRLKSLLKQIEQLPPQEQDKLFSLAQSGKASTLNCPAEGLDDWQNELTARGLAKGTITLYTRTVKRFLDLYPMPSARDARNYSVQRLQQVTPTKVRNDQKSLKSFFSFLENEGLWVDNPTKGVQLIKTQRVIRQAPEKEHVDKLLTAWQGSQRRLKERLFILLFTDTGMRIRETCSLAVKNVNLERLEIKVMGKGGKERIVPVEYSANPILQPLPLAMLFKTLRIYTLHLRPR